MTALRAEGYGRLMAAGCVEGLRKRVLKMDRPNGRRVLKFDGAFGPEGCGLPKAMLIKSALRDLLSVSCDMINILVISRCAAPPYPAAPDFPPSGGQNKSLYAFLSRHGPMAKHP